MAKETHLSTGVGTSDPPTLDTQAVIPMASQGPGASAPPWELSAGDPLHHDPLHHNPWSFIAPGAMQTPSPNTTTSLNATTTLPYHGGQQNGANLTQSDIPAPRKPEEAATMPQLETEAVGADAATAEAKGQVSSDDLSDVQMSDRSESQISSESSNDIDRQDKYAFNYSTQAYDHRVPQNLTGGITIFAEKVCMGTLIHQYLEKADKQGDADICPTLVPHEVEMLRNPKAVECVWVGMLPVVLQDGGEDGAEAQPTDVPKTPSKGQKRAKKAQSLIDLEDGQLDIIPHNPKALRVVAKMQTKQVKIWHLYALTTSDTGSKLCQGWKVPNEEVFFFKALRDDAVSGLMKRKQATELKIKARIFPPAPIPAVVSQSSTPSKQAMSPVTGPVTPTASILPSPVSSGKMEESSRTLRAATALSQKDDPAGIPAGSPAKTGGDDESPTADKLSRAGGPDSVDDDGSEDAYPEHAVPSWDPTFKGFLDNMLRELSVAEPEVVSLGQKRKRVAFDTGGGEVASTRRKTGSGSRSDMQAQEGEDGAAEPSSFVIEEQTRHLSLKLQKMVNNLVANQDVPGLRQCVTMMECVQGRSAPGPNSALAPYLSTSSKKDADPLACKGKLREILDLFPKLRDVDGLNRHVLAFMIYGLRETGQSIEVGLIEACIMCYSRLFKQKYGDSPPAKMDRPDVIDMICQARDDAEQMLKKTPLNKIARGRSKKL